MNSKTLLFTQNISWYLVQNWNQCNFGLFWPKFGCHRNYLCYHTREKCLDILYRTEISTIFSYFCPNSVTIATPFSPLKIQIAYLNSPTTKILLFRRKMCWRLVQSWNQCILAYFCLNLVAMATPFALLKMLIAYLYPPTTKTLPYTQKVSRYGVQSWN